MLKMRIETKNAAFCPGDCGGAMVGKECARILREVADKLDKDYDTEGVCHDINGNRVGEWKLTNR